MKMFVLSLFACFMIWLPMAGQEIHAPAEIMKIMKDSKLTYSVGTFDSDTVSSEREFPLILDQYYVHDTEDSGQVLLSYYDLVREHPDVAKIIERAEGAFSKSNMEETRENYLRALDSLPNYSRLMTYVGQTYEHAKDLDEAIRWYRKALRINDVDFMTHWFLADALAVHGDLDEALDQILIAHVLNRNNPRIMASFERILKKKGLRYVPFDFSRYYELRRIDDKTIWVGVDEQHMEWFPYAMAKAVWAFEPGYREKMEKEFEVETAVTEEKECLLMSAIGYIDVAEDDSTVVVKKDDVTDAGINALLDCFQEGTLDEFIYYESLLREAPVMSHLVRPDFFDSIVTYVRKHRIEPVDQ